MLDAMDVALTWLGVGSLVVSCVVIVGLGIALGLSHRRAARVRLEIRCREERRKQLEVGVTPITSRTMKRAA